MFFSGNNAGVQQDVFAPHSTKASHRTASASVPRAARGDPLVARPAGLERSRAATTASETTEQDFSPGLRGFQDERDFGGGPGAGGLLDALAPHSTTAVQRAASGAACVSQAAFYVSPTAARVSPMDARRTSLALSQPRVAVPERETAERENQDGRWSEMYFSGHNAGVQ